MKLAKLFQKPITNNAVAVTLQLIKQLNIPVTTTTVINYIEQHPDYPSLLCISDSLRHWKVDNLAIQVTADRLPDLPTPFIAHLNKGSGYFTLVTNVTSESIAYVTDKGKKTSKNLSQFVDEWSGVVLLVEAKAQAGEKNYPLQRKTERIQNARIPGIIAAGVILVVLYGYLSIQIDSWTTGFPTLLLLLKLSGCFITGILLWFEIDQSNPILKEICSGGKSTSCEAVLKSKGAKLFGTLSWSEIGFFYFTGSFLFLLSSVNNPFLAFAALSWLNLLALPYIIFSVFYQWRIAKQWCPLCLAVQGLLLLEGIIVYFGYWKNTPVEDSINILLDLKLISLFVVPILFWVFTKPLLLKVQQVERIIKERNRFKYNPQIFETMLTQERRLSFQPEGLGIVLGNSNAKIH